MKKVILYFTVGLILFSAAYLAAFPPSIPPSATSVSDTAYNATTWDGDTTTAASKNALRDKIETLGGAIPAQADCSGITEGLCIDTDDGIVYYYDGDSVEILGSVSFEGTLTNSAGLAGALSDETGTGVAVFATSPTLVTPTLGNASATSLTLTASDDSMWYFNAATASESDWWTGINNDSEGDDDDPWEVRQSATPGTNVAISVAASSPRVTTFTGGQASRTPVTDSTADFAANFTGADLYGGTFIADTDDGDLQLPLMAVGMNFCIIAGGTLEIVAATNANDGYLLDGVDTAEDNSVVSTGTAGDIACFQYYTADDWLITTNGWATE